MEHELLERRSATPHRPMGAAPAATHGGAAGRLLAIQRTAGNSAVASLLGLQRSPAERVPVTQREGLDDLFAPNPFDPGSPGQTGGERGDPATAPPPGGGINELGPVARTGTLIADAIIANSYTPGAGNVF